jgi:hypothetical protein
LFKKRPYNASILPLHYMTIFPGQIAFSLRGQQVVLVSWIEGIHPGWGVRGG